jgi:hypothetical protein
VDWARDRIAAIIMSYDEEIVAARPLIVVTLPLGCQNLGVEFAGTPPVIANVHPKSPLVDQMQVGLYVHGICLPGVEIINIIDPQQLLNLIQSNIANLRQLLLSSSLFYVDESLGPPSSSYRGPLYKHTLPAMPNLGFSLIGFPPIVMTVSPGSPMSGRLIPGQTAHALLVPGEQRLDLAAGAFTSATLQEKLNRTSSVVGRQLVVHDDAPAPREKGSSKAFVAADCVVS